MESLHHITELLLQKIDSIKVEILPEAVVALSWQGGWGPEFAFYDQEFVRLI